MRFQYLCAVCVLSFGIAVENHPASAATYFYSMNGTLSDGGTVSSNFTIDWGTTSDSINVSSLTLIDPLVSGTVSNLQSQTLLGLCSGTSCVPFHLNASLGSFSLGINMAFSPPDLNGEISLLIISSFSRLNIIEFQPFNQGGGDFTSASVSLLATPLPGTLPLFATGLGALGLLGWRRKRDCHHAARAGMLCLARDT